MLAKIVDNITLIVLIHAYSTADLLDLVAGCILISFGSLGDMHTLAYVIFRLARLRSANNLEAEQPTWLGQQIWPCCPGIVH
jgi:hypothetical protein